MQPLVSLLILTLSLSASISFPLPVPRYLRDFFQAVLPTAPNSSPIMNIPDIIKSPFTSKDPSAGESDSLIVSDVIGKDRAIQIYAGFTRDIDTISRRLDDTKQNSTVLAPLNSEIQKLPRKPWENPKDYDAMGVEAYKGEEGEDRAHANLRRFVEAHVVPASPWEKGDKVETIGGGKVWWEEEDGKRVVCFVHNVLSNRSLLTQLLRFTRAISRFIVSRRRSRTVRFGCSRGSSTTSHRAGGVQGDDSTTLVNEFS